MLHYRLSPPQQSSDSDAAQGRRCEVLPGPDRAVPPQRPGPHPDRGDGRRPRSYSNVRDLPGPPGLRAPGLLLRGAGRPRDRGWRVLPGLARRARMRVSHVGVPRRLRVQRTHGAQAVPRRGPAPRRRIDRIRGRRPDVPGGPARRGAGPAVRRRGAPARRGGVRLWLRVRRQVLHGPEGPPRELGLAARLVSAPRRPTLYYTTGP